MKLENFVLPSIALGAAIVLTTPQQSHAFSVLSGQVVNTNQMDYRVLNNFLDNNANNSGDHPNFPGFGGATQALWKASYEWCSEPRGTDGSGDPHQGILGSGNSNFDAMFVGEATSVGFGTNVIAALDQNGGGVFAFMQPGGGGSWMIRFYENWVWNDGPNTNIGGNVDLQNVGCHEYGHALGLGHSTTFGATMFGSTSPGAVGGRSIGTDDIAGVQFIYGTKDAAKPRIDSAFNIGGIVEITGENFDPTNNEVWFTRATPSSAGSGGSAIRVFNVPSSNGGTFISSLIPGTAGIGEVMVKRAGGSSQADTSNPWPFDPLAVPPPLPVISSLSKTQVVPLVPGGTETFSILGTDLLGVTDVRIDGSSLDDGSTYSGSWTIVDGTQIDVVMPLAANAGLIDVEVEAPGGIGMTQIEVVPPTTPAMDILEDQIVQLFGLNFAVTGNDGDVIFLLFSPNDGPTTIPGIFDWDIGGGVLNSVFDIKTWTIGPKLWRKTGFGPFSGLTPGETLYFQGWVFELANGYALPGTTTNALSIDVLL